MDTTEDACQGDSGGPLVGHFHDQIKAIELFPKEVEDKDLKLSDTNFFLKVTMCPLGFIT